MRALLVAASLLGAADSQSQHLYQATTMRAAPGKLLELIGYVHAHMTELAAHGRPAFLMRHSQGDQWDLLLLAPITAYAQLDTVAKNRPLAGPEYETLVARDEDIFVYGPGPEVVKQAFDGARLFHVEMFLALPGKRAALVRQRRMENAYLAHLGRPQNLVFVRDRGATWDVFTIGCYRDLKHFAESANIPADREDEAARAAGFEAASQIGPYLRTLILEHHDTLAVAVNE